jgi:integrase
VLNRWFGSLILHEITAHGIEQFKPERLAGKWRGHNTNTAPKAIKLATVNRELDTLKSVLANAVEWHQLLESPAVNVKRLAVDNRRTRILSAGEQMAVMEACPRKVRAIVAFALATGARIGEVLALRWEHCRNGRVSFIQTKNGQMRELSISPAIEAVLAQQPRIYPAVFAKRRSGKPMTVNGVRHVFARAVARAGITTGDVSLHTLRHTAISRMIAGGYDDYMVMSIWPLVHADAGALHASHRRAKDRGLESGSFGHKQGTRRRTR